jgi:hypothetical protein
LSALLARFADQAEAPFRPGLVVGNTVYDISRWYPRIADFFCG